MHLLDYLAKCEEIAEEKYLTNDGSIKPEALKRLSERYYNYIGELWKQYCKDNSLDADNFNVNEETMRKFTGYLKNPANAHGQDYSELIKIGCTRILVDDIQAKNLLSFDSLEALLKAWNKKQTNNMDVLREEYKQLKYPDEIQI